MCALRTHQLCRAVMPDKGNKFEVMSCYEGIQMIIFCITLVTIVMVLENLVENFDAPFPLFKFKFQYFVYYHCSGTPFNVCLILCFSNYCLFKFFVLVAFRTHYTHVHELLLFFINSKLDLVLNCPYFRLLHSLYP